MARTVPRSKSARRERRRRPRLNADPASPPSPSTSPGIAAFPSEIESAAHAVRCRVSAIVETVCGGSPRAQDITDRFGVHRKLGWQIWNVAFANDPLAAVRFLPNAKGIHRLRAAAEARGVPSELLSRLNETIEQFQQLAARHAEDRQMLEMLVESGTGASDPAVDERWRKQAFIGNAYIWGVHAKRLLATVLLHPSARRGAFDIVRLLGLIDLVRTRPNVRWPFSQSVVQTDDGEERLPRREPLGDPKLARKLGVPLMEEFCSTPLPPVERRVGEGGMVEDELLPGPVGNTGASTVITGELLREVAPIKPTVPGEEALFGSGVRTPGELMVSDHIVHKDLWPGATRELRVFGELISSTTRDERDRLPVPERLQYLGRGMERVRTADVPRYGELLECAFDRTGWNPNDFDVYRIRMRYPPIPISVMVRHPMTVPDEH